VAAHEIIGVEVDRTSHVRVEFTDGMTATFRLGPLRLACPCAECNARRRDGRPVSTFVEQGGAITILAAAMAGAWGLDLDWSDGHSTGIYAFEKLREWADAALHDVELSASGES
jgi:DUF971 family protein